MNSKDGLNRCKIIPATHTQGKGTSKHLSELTSGQVYSREGPATCVIMTEGGVVLCLERTRESKQMISMSLEARNMELTLLNLCRFQ